MTVTEARAQLPALLDAVEEGHEVTITRHGKPVAVLISHDRRRRDRLARHEAEVDRLRRRMEEAKDRPLFEGPGFSAERADELVAWIRAGRDGDDPWEA